MLKSTNRLRCLNRVWHNGIPTIAPSRQANTELEVLLDSRHIATGNPADDEIGNACNAAVHEHQHEQWLGLHRQPAVPLVSLAGFAARPHIIASQQQPRRGTCSSSLPSQRRQPEGASAAVRFSTSAAAVAELNTDSSGSGSAGQAAAGSQQSGSHSVGARHPEQPAGATAAGANAWWDGEGCFEYRAPLSTTVRRLKKLSLFSCMVSVAAAPIIVGLDPGSTASAGGKVAIAGMLASFGAFTTGLLHWFVSPYVHRLRYDPGNGWIEATRLDILARPVVTHFDVGEARYADTMRPQSTFKIRNSYYYLDADHLGNQQLYDRLNIADPDAPSTSNPGVDTSAPSASNAAAAQSGAPAARESGDQQREGAEANAPRADEEVPEEAVAPTAPPEPAADEASRAQAEQAAEMVQPELKR